MRQREMVHPIFSDAIRAEWERLEEGVPGSGLAASSKVILHPPVLGEDRGSAGEIKGPREVGQGSSSSSTRLERNLSFKM